MEWLYGVVASLRGKGRDWAGVALSLLLAFGVWLLSTLGTSSLSVLSVNVQAESDLDGRVAESSDMARIQARCRASGYRVSALRNQEVRRVHLQAADLHPIGEGAYYITASALEKYVQDIYGDDVRLESFVSDTVIFHFPPQNYKKVPVVPVKAIRFRSQYVETSPLKVEPDSVIVYGDPLLLERISQVRTEAIRLTDVASGIQDLIPLNPIPGTRYSTPTVKYSISVSRAVEITREVAVRVTGAPEGVSVKAYPGTVRLTVFSVFPMLSDPLKDLSLEVPYEDFLRSVTGDCVPRLMTPLQGVIRTKIAPRVVHCVEEAGR